MNNITYNNSITAVEYNNLRNQAGWKPYSLQQMQKAIESSSYIVAAVINGETVAAARLISDNACYGIIADVVVSSKCRGLGVGRSLVLNIIDHIETSLENGEEYRLNVMAYKGKDGFYEKLGFVSRPNEELGAGLTVKITGK